MSLLQDFSSQAGSFDIAIMAATISILLGGILFGVGIGFGLRRIRLLGAEEVGQGIISAAMVGALFSFTALIDSTVPSLVPSGPLPACSGIQNPAASPFSYYACNLQALSDSFASLGSSLSRSADISGFASSLAVDAGVVSAQPFFALRAASESLSEQARQAYSLSAIAYLELELSMFISSSALAVFLPVGLVLRTFFATRRLGAAAIAIAVAAYMVFPLLFLHAFSASMSNAAALQSAEASSLFNSQFASLPLLDLDQTGAARQKISEMSSGDFGGKVQALFPLSFRAVALAQADLIFYPLLSLAVSAVAAIEFYRMLCAPIFLPYFDSV